MANLALILADVQKVIAIGNLAIQLSQDAAPFLKSAYNILFEGKTLTEAERAELIATETKLRNQLQSATAD